MNMMEVDDSFKAPTAAIYSSNVFGLGTKRTFAERCSFEKSKEEDKVHRDKLSQSPDHKRFCAPEQLISETERLQVSHKVCLRCLNGESGHITHVLTDVYVRAFGQF